MHASLNWLTVSQGESLQPVRPHETWPPLDLYGWGWERGASDCPATVIPPGMTLPSPNA